MNIFIEVNLNTDGDFYLNEDYKFKEDINYDYESYYIYKNFKETEPPHPSWDSESWLRYEAKNFLIEILINLRFNNNHYYLMSTLCDFFDKAIKKINTIGIREYYIDHLWGNYEGTSITLNCY